MDDRLKESLSALMDDETNELELQRLLSHADKDELLGTWKAYHSVRTILQHEQEEVLAIDISQSVSEAIAQEAPLAFNKDVNSALVENSDQTSELSASLSHSEFQPPLVGQTAEKDVTIVRGRSGLMAQLSSGFAIAASIFVAFVFVLQNGIETGRPELQNNQLASETASSLSSHAEAFQKVSALPADLDGTDVSKKQPVIIVEFTEEHARRFNEYLLRHAEHSVASSHAGMTPLARVASVHAVGI